MFELRKINAADDDTNIVCFHRKINFFLIFNYKVNILMHKAA